MHRATNKQNDLLRRVQRFLRRTSMKPTAFGRIALKDPSLVSDLEAGRSPSIRTAERIDAFMKGYTE